MKFQFFLILLVLSISTVGCVENIQQDTQEKYNLEYDFHKGDVFSYQIDTVIHNQYKSDSKLADMVVNSAEINDIILDISNSVIVNDDESNENYYHLNINNYGDILEHNSSDLIIPEIEPKFMLILPFPKKEIVNGDVWESTLNENNSHFAERKNIEYQLFANTTFRCLGNEIISVNAGDFNCVGIERRTNYVLSINSIHQNRTVYTQKITGTIIGASWFDLEKGFLVESEHDFNKNIKTNYLEINEELGFESLYQETPINSTIAIELLNVQGD
ncbi:hypothetical protein J2755_000530 [Methanohalophilus levihalophilus]|uniref:hypothetical protein n=1 Tax=Methanohalophilus levihalophilus TaxID=1431282 RepID=UPI001AE5EB6F|nr:hypothetical protein [Methanohalophilus levihalophilus]MBP2029610.1 hypothetical protein [Methanohalophilus levihalophilus]